MVNGIETQNLADQLTLQIRLWELLAKRTKSYTAGDGSSIPIEIAQSLLQSICYTLGIGQDTSLNRVKALEKADLDAEYERGIRRIADQLDASRDLWKAICFNMPDIQNRSLRDTLRSIGTFRNRYNYDFFAHEIPCDIDYQLCHPVPESLLGVDYVMDYLKRLSIETDFLKRLDEGRCIGVLQRSCPDYKGLLINLYEPVATNVIGLALIGEEAAVLDISPVQLKRIEAVLQPLTKESAKQVLHSAVQTACENLNIRNKNARNYLELLSHRLYPRIETAMTHGNLNHIFI